MTTFKVTERQNDHYGKTYPEYTKFPRQVGIVTWVSLLVAPNRVQKFALCNLTKVREPFMTDMLYTCAEPPPVQGCELPPPMVVFPMPQLYPQAVFLGIANGLLERAKQVVEIRLAVADGQLPERKAA